MTTPTKTEIDEWYERAVDGLGQMGAYFIETRNSEDASSSFLTAIRSLAECKKSAYRAVGITEEPKLISWREAVGRHYKF